MSDIAIKVDNVSKTFKLPHEKTGSVKSVFTGLFSGKRTYEKQEVLKDISFEIQKGEFFGIVGRNGSGKSTLLKLLAGIYSPNKGHIQINGKLTPFIELGVGFNPELTGRENVFLNGALLGFSRTEMSEMYDEIVEFAELNKFMDQKLKNYSSGMQVRLAFSIAIRAQTNILVLDEVLAVGDEAFQQKCIDIFENYKSKKQTIILVSHDMAMIRRFCTQAALIHNGKLLKVGDSKDVAADYSKLNEEKIINEIEKKNSKIKKTKIHLKITNSKGKEVNDFNIFEPVTIDVSWPHDLMGVKNVGVAIHKNSGEYIFGDNTFKKVLNINKNKISYKVNLDVGVGSYHFVVGLFGTTAKDIIEFLPRGPEFIIKSGDPDQVEGLVRLKSEWKA